MQTALFRLVWNGWRSAAQCVMTMPRLFISGVAVLILGDVLVGLLAVSWSGSAFSHLVALLLLTVVSAFVQSVIITCVLRANLLNDRADGFVWQLPEAQPKIFRVLLGFQLASHLASPSGPLLGQWVFLGAVLVVILTVVQVRTVLWYPAMAVSGSGASFGKAWLDGTGLWWQTAFALFFGVLPILVLFGFRALVALHSMAYASLTDAPVVAHGAMGLAALLGVVGDSLAVVVMAAISAAIIGPLFRENAAALLRQTPIDAAERTRLIRGGAIIAAILAVTLLLGRLVPVVPGAQMPVADNDVPVQSASSAPAAAGSSSVDAAPAGPAPFQHIPVQTTSVVPMPPMPVANPSVPMPAGHDLPGIDQGIQINWTTITNGTLPGDSKAIGGAVIDDAVIDQHGGVGLGRGRMVCRAYFRGMVIAGQTADGACAFPWHGKEAKTSSYDIAVAKGHWATPGAPGAALISSGGDAHYICQTESGRADEAIGAGMVVGDACHYVASGMEKTTLDFQLFYPSSKQSAPISSGVPDWSIAQPGLIRVVNATLANGQALNVDDLPSDTLAGSLALGHGGKRIRLPVCRGVFAGQMLAGRVADGACSVLDHGSPVPLSDFEIPHADGHWGKNGQVGAVMVGNGPDSGFFCRAARAGGSMVPGMLGTDNKCHIAVSNRDVAVSDAELFYLRAASSNRSGP